MENVMAAIKAFTATEGGTIRQNWCFANAKKLAVAIPGLSYEEGSAFIDGLEPIHHAWNSFRGERIDVTATVAGFKVLAVETKVKVTHSRMKQMARSALYSSTAPMIKSSGSFI